MTRRELLQRASLLALSGLLPTRLAGWASAGRGKARKRLVVVFLRGAVDGLSVVVPHGEDAYHDARPSIALGAPGKDGGVLDLDGLFGLHPSLEPVLPFWKEGSLAFVHASGSPEANRSHFDAQDFMETGTPGVKTTPDGWMNRLLAALPAPHGPTAAVNLGPTIPRILAGGRSVANLPLGRKAGKELPVDRPEVAEAFDRMYLGDDPVSVAYREGKRARSSLLADLAEDMRRADNGAPGPSGLADEGEQLGRLLAKDDGIELAFLAVGGWDTHINQGAEKGQLAGKLASLGRGLAGLVRGLGPAYADTVVLVLSEFGRTFKENGNGGTDHGHGNALWLLGGPVRGGKVYGTWPGLAEDKLFEGRDLEVTTDFRAVVSSALERHLGLTAGQRAAVIPGFTPSRRGIYGLFA